MKTHFRNVNSVEMHTIFITGATGYIGRHLVKNLLATGTANVKALTRPQSAGKLPPGCEIVRGDALDKSTYKDSVAPSQTMVHLVGVAHPSPSKRQQFRDIDLESLRQAAEAAIYTGIKHFIYLSVAQYPTEIMKEYQQIRASGEKIVAETGIPSSFIRPWYVLGPGHWWPLLLKPLFWTARVIPPYREALKKLDTITLKEMIGCLAFAIEHPPTSGTHIYEVSDIKKMDK